MAGQQPPENEEQQLGHAPKQDGAWVTQQRVFEEIAEVQPDRLQVADFLQESEGTNKVIVPNAQQYERVKWEFPEEEEKPRETVPRVKAQEWVPVNDVEHIVQKTNYDQQRIQRAWPPPGYGEEENVELQRASQVKAKEDGAWIQGQQDEENGADGPVGNAPWREVSGSSLRERVWPPPEPEKLENDFTGGPKLSVQWPPPEFEEQYQQSVEIIQTHLPAKKKDIQWPPLRPGQDQADVTEEPVQNYA